MDATVSIEVPVFKGRYLADTLRSVLAQTSGRWTLSLYWDGGDRRSRRILEAVRRFRDPRIEVHFGENRGIAGARRALSERSRGDWILPLDDDDLLAPTAVERFLAEAEERPWAELLRARRRYIDEHGEPLPHGDIFPFEPHHYGLGLVRDVWNFSQPYAIRRSAYERTSGWTGFSDLFGAGEDGALYLELVELGAIELIDDVLYHYRISDVRTSLRIGREGAYEMWRRLADAAIRRTGLFVRRVTEEPPFHYERLPRPALVLRDVTFAIRCAPGAEHRLEAWRDALRSAGVREHAIAASAASASEPWMKSVERATGGAVASAGAPAAVALVDARAEPVEPALFESLLARLNRPDVDLVAPRIVSRTGTPLVVGASFDARGVPVPIGSAVGASRAEWVGPGLVLARREAFRSVRGVDGALSPTIAVIDLCLRLSARGLTIAEAPEAIVYTEPLSSAELAGWAEYARRWRDALKRPPGSASQ